MKCKFIKSDNTECHANAMTDNNYCFMHAPETKQARSEAIMKGGFASKKYLLENQGEVKLDNSHDVKVFLGQLINAVWQGKVPATPVASTLGFLARCFLDAQEKSEIEIRIDELERKFEKSYEQQVKTPEN